MLLHSYDGIEPRPDAKPLLLLGLDAVYRSLAAAELPDALELKEVVVSAPGEHKLDELARPATVLTGEDLRSKVGTTVGETLRQELGVTSQSFGPGVGMPVIRGQTGPG